MSALLGQELKSLRERLGATLEELGQLTNRSRSHLCKIELRGEGQLPVPDGLLSDLLNALLALGYDRDEAVTSALRELNDRRAALAGAGTTMEVTG